MRFPALPVLPFTSIKNGEAPYKKLEKRTAHSLAGKLRNKQRKEYEFMWLTRCSTTSPWDGLCCPSSRPLRIGQCQVQQGGGRKKRLPFSSAGISRTNSNKADGSRDSSDNSSSSNGARGANAIRAAVGIDLGTTTSAIAVAGPDGRPMVVEDEKGRAVIPSVVFVRQDGSVLVGEEAAAAAESDPANAFYGIKRLMGRTYREVVQERDEQSPYIPSSRPPTSSMTPGEPRLSREDEVLAGYDQQRQRQRRFRSYSLVEGPDGCVQVSCPAFGRDLTLQEISSHLLRHLVSRARTFLERQIVRQQQQLGEELGEGGVATGTAGGGGGGDRRCVSTVEVLDAVITVPAHFGPTQRRAVSEAARAAGLQRVSLLQEPIAAAMAYGFGSPQVPYDVLLVYDLGGGTLDLTVVEAFEGIMEQQREEGLTETELSAETFEELVSWGAIFHRIWIHEGVDLVLDPSLGLNLDPVSVRARAAALRIWRARGVAREQQHGSSLSSRHSRRRRRRQQQLVTTMAAAEAVVRQQLLLRRRSTSRRRGG
ncbi:heat shock protein Hsp70F [Volvox carteri f. nagariensis]|uniref:Heat shock protein Hsp70F n=1 Tax=Volvox carteri f. nagariensis TaxID=3068 RepID=D8UDM2_VOLCA|nr:heat shock protein Hsp70F [Volvox carteri f. nagariensis]EFJ42218.1 heat shock protein Hsp70F [Volvox carteri f. nagariensis]|eukprot:XP_002956761.1 heat shock protein Hsp70F [Volvox carteri f. nagariensis]